MEDITKQSKKQLAINFILTFALLVTLSLISFYFLEFSTIGFNRYSVSIGPFLEEAFKGGLIFLISLTILLSYPRLKKKYPSLKNLKKTLNSKKYWFLLGAWVGVGIALWEAFVEYSPGLHRVIPSLNHICWTATVGGGIWISMRGKREWRLLKLMLPYMAAVHLHILWNYHSYLEKIEGSEFILGGVSFVLTLCALFIVWKFGK